MTVLTVGLAGPALSLEPRAAVPTAKAPVAETGSAPSTDADAPAVAALAEDFDLSLEEASRRIARQTTLQKVSDSARRRSAAVGTAFIDHANGGRLVVWLKDMGQRAQVEQAAREHQSEGLLEVRRSPHSMQEVLEANAVVAERLAAEPDEVKLRLTSGVDGTRNAIVVTRPSTVSAAQRVLLDNLEAEFGLLLEEEIADGEPIPFGLCVNTAGTTGNSGSNCDPPLRGGTRMGPGAASDKCTAGFIGRHADGRRFIITAGHCAYFNGGNGTIWNSVFTDGNGHNVGPMHSWIYGSAGDMAVIAIPSTRLPALTPRPWVNVRAWPGVYPTTENESYVINGIGSSGSIPNAGNYLCHTGKTIGTRCGAFNRGNVTKTYSNAPKAGTTTVNGLAAVNAVACQGDSGGPVYVGGLAFGVLSGGDGNSSGYVDNKYCTTGFLYQGMAAINTHLHVYPMTPSNTPACPPDSGGGTTC